VKFISCRCNFRIIVNIYTRRGSAAAAAAGGFVSTRQRWNGSATFGPFQCVQERKRDREKNAGKKLLGSKLEKKGVVAVVGLSNRIPNGVLLRSSRLHFHHDVAQNKIPPSPNQKFRPSKRRNPCLFVLGVYNNTNIELRD
jgi:hypothetical protein